MYEAVDKVLSEVSENAEYETVWEIARGLVEGGFWQHKMTK
jgi:hypothetical protein